MSRDFLATMISPRKHSAEYSAWASMIQRCHNPKHPRFSDYGARGISVCPEWRSSFDAFIAAVGQRPGSGYTLERQDNNANYEPGNVIWATRIHQQRNRRNTRLIPHNHEEKTAGEWSEILGVKAKTIISRYRNGHAIDRSPNRKGLGRKSRLPIVPEGYKYCTGCKGPILIGYFNINRRHKDGLSYRCCDCDRRYVRTLQTKTSAE